MTGTGDLLHDALLMCLHIYLFMGGWTVTIAGLVLWTICWRRGVEAWATLAGIAACFGPVAVFVPWRMFGERAPWIESSSTGELALAAGFVVLMLSSPVTALGALREMAARSAPKR